MRILAALGRSARIAPGQSAEIVIGMDAVNGELGPDFAALTCPATFVLGTGGHSGASEQEMSTIRAAAFQAVASNSHVSVFATAPGNHVQILSKSSGVVADAVEHVISQA